jgi:hypothetical protein
MLEMAHVRRRDLHAARLRRSCFLFASCLGHEHPLSQLISQQAKKHIASSVSQLVERDDDAALEGMIAALQQLAPEKRRAMLDKLLA